MKEGKYLDEILKRRGATWLRQGRIVVIPAGFNSEPSDLQVLLSPELLQRVEELEDDLHYTQTRLGEYLCPHCQAELSASGSFEVSRYADAYYQTFHCGYSAVGGRMERPCPSDPKFPTLDDYELKLKSSETKWGIEWTCDAVPKTAMARRIHLPVGIGRSEEQARQYVVAWYQQMAKRWEKSV